MTGTYLGAELVMIDNWVEAQLAAKATELNAISTGLSGRVYPDAAPIDAVFPVIIYQCQDPPRDVRGVGVSRVMVDTLYVVKAVAQADTYAPLAPIAKVIDDALTSAAGSAIEDGFVLASVRQEQFRFVEVDAGTKFRHLGGEYQIHAQAEQ